MRILLGDGSGLTSRQVAGRLAALGHHVGVLSSDPAGLTRFTRATSSWHRAPPFGDDPLAWLDAAIEVFTAHRYDVLLPTQEHVTVLAALPSRLRVAGVTTIAPSFDALLAVQDKVVAHRTLERLGVAHPPAAIALDADQVREWREFPVYAKAPIGTATSGVHHVTSAEQLAALADAGSFAEAFESGGVLLQTPVSGPLAMLQAVFDRGRLVAFHANLRVREGARGGASHKQGIDLPAARALVVMLGSALGWHGALSADVVLGDAGPVIIDINPRLVEPVNAARCGVDLVGALLELTRGNRVAEQPPGTGAVRTHQLLLAVLGAASQGRGRRGVAAELFGGVTHRGSYRDSREELTPVRGDLRAGLPLLITAASTLVAPSTWRWFASGGVANYALTPAAWRTICRVAEPGDPRPPMGYSRDRF